VRYVHEPFNIGIERDNSPLQKWFEVLRNAPKERQVSAQIYIESFLKLSVSRFIKRLFRVKRLGGIKRIISDSIKNIIAKRTAIKDPIALMSADWLYETFNLDVVILIRHPAAFVASLKVKQWEFDFSNFSSQLPLFKPELLKYESAIMEAVENKKDIVDQGIILWNVIHSLILFYQEKYSKEWYFVRHEDLSIRPEDEFKKIFKYLDLNFDSKVTQYIRESTKSSVKGRLKRDSISNITSWKQRLSEEEVDRVKTGTKSVWCHYYEEKDW
jgi:hypothetical protein